MFWVKKRFRKLEQNFAQNILMSFYPYYKIRTQDREFTFLNNLLINRRGTVIPIFDQNSIKNFMCCVLKILILICGGSLGQKRG